MAIYGKLEVHCAGNMESDCDFKSERDADKTQCKFNCDMCCVNSEVFDILMRL